MRLLPILLLLSACSAGTKLDVRDFVQSECPDDPDTDPPPEALLALGGDGQITVAHRGYPANCCVTLEASARLLEERRSIEVTYDEDGEECDCICSFDLGYDIVGVPRGSWTVTANLESALVEVD